MGEWSEIAFIPLEGVPGRDVFKDLLLGGDGSSRRSLRTNSSDSTFTKAVDRLRTLPYPFFLWVHIYPPHAPYLPSPKFKYAFLAEQTLETFGSQKRYLGRNYPKELQPVMNKLGAGTMNWS